MYIACQHGHEDVVFYLLEKNANIKTIDKKYLTPLHCAVLANNLLIVKQLFARKLDINALNIQKMTPAK